MPLNHMQPKISELDNIIRAAQKGDEAAFEELLNHRYERLC